MLIGAAALWLFDRIQSEPIILPRKTFVDVGEAQPGHGYIHVSGTITGPPGPEGVGNRNNFFGLWCSQEQRQECDVIDFSQIGRNHIGQVTMEVWPIAEWTPELVVVRSTMRPEACSRVVVNILRRTKEVQYIREPQMQNASVPNCQMAEMRVFRWSLEEPPFWQEADQRMAELNSQ